MVDLCGIPITNDEKGGIFVPKYSVQKESFIYYYVHVRQVNKRTDIIHLP